MVSMSSGTSSLRRVLIVPYVALVLALAVTIGALSYFTGVNAVGKVSEHSLLETVGRIGQAVDRHVVGSGAVLEAAFPAGMPAPVSMGDELPSLRERFWIATSLHIDPNNYVYYGNRQGQAIGLYRRSLDEGELRIKLTAEEPRTFYRFRGIAGPLAYGEREKKVFDPRSRPWYKVGESTGVHTWTSVYIDFRTEELVATRARRVLNAAGEFEGVVATDVSLRALNDFVRQLKISPNGLAFIMEPDGNLIASSATPYVHKLPDGSNARLQAADSGNPLIARISAEVRQAIAADKAPLPQTRVFEGADGGPVFAAFDRVKDDAGLEWVTVVAVPRSDYMGGVTGNVLRTALVALLAAAAAVAIGMAILWWVSRDLRRLSEAARKVGEGELDAPVGVNRRDEIGDLARSFEAMQLRLRTDKLTGLANREAMVRACGKAIQARRSDPAGRCAVLFVDLDDFKAINDQHGHDAGDRALIEVGRRLSACTSPGDQVGRYAGDEFVVLIEVMRDEGQAERMRERIELALAEPLYVPTPLGEVAVSLHGSVGMAQFPLDGNEADTLIKRADEDMYRRKFSDRAELVRS